MSLMPLAVAARVPETEHCAVVLTTFALTSSWNKNVCVCLQTCMEE